MKTRVETESAKGDPRIDGGHSLGLRQQHAQTPHSRSSHSTTWAKMIRAPLPETPAMTPPSLQWVPILVRIGSPTYSADVPAGGSTLSMSFPGDGGAPGASPDSFYYSNAPLLDITQDITYSFDVKLGTPASSFGVLGVSGR